MQIRYIEYGKVFLTSSRGAMEYSALDRSDNDLTSNTKTFYLDEIATFNRKHDLQSLGSQQSPKVSIALINWGKSHYLFMQLQQRWEDEFVQVRGVRSTQRSFTQARFVFVDRNEFNSWLPKKVGLISSLIYENPNYPGEKRLKDYIDPQRGNINNRHIEEENILPIPASYTPELLASVINALYHDSQPNKEVSEFIQPREPKPLFIYSHLNLDEKILIFDLVRYWLYPALGNITFSSDYITDRDTTLFLCNEFHETGKVESKRIFNENSLSNASFEDYFGAVSSLSKDQLYHDTLIYYLRIDLSPTEAVMLFKLIETDHPFSIDDIIKIIVARQAHIKDEHLAAIIQRRFITEEQLDKLRNLLRRISVKKRLIILRVLLDKTHNRLEKYYLFHLAAMEGIVAGSIVATNIRELLKFSVTQSTLAALDLILEENKKEIYQELIWLDYKLTDDGKLIAITKDLQFAPTSNNNNNDNKLFYILMGRQEEAFFQSIQLLFSTIIKPQLFEKIIDGLKNKECRWNLVSIDKFWQITIDKTSELFNILLSHLTSDQTSDAELLKKHPLMLKEFLTDGKKILYGTFIKKQSKTNNNETKGYVRNGTPMGLLSLLEDHISKGLRTICLIVSRYQTTGSTKFAYWWLTEELAYTVEDIIIPDYTEVLRYYSAPQYTQVGEASETELFILSGGKLGGGLSIQECIPTNDNIKIQTFLETDYYNKLIKTWLDMEFTIPSKDIINLVNRLPDNISAAFLGKIVLTKNKVQKDEIQKLPPQVAHTWLDVTKSSRIKGPKGDDALFNILLNLEKPSIDFVRHMLLFESANLNQAHTWKDYSTTIKRMYPNKWKRVVSDPLLDRYIELTSSLDGHLELDKYQKILIMMAQFNSPKVADDLTKEFDIITFSLILEFLFKNSTNDLMINQIVGLLLNSEFSILEIDNTIKELRDEDLNFLHDFAINHLALLKCEISTSVEAEYKKRHIHESVIVNVTSGMNPPVYREPITHSKKQKKTIKGETKEDAPRKQPSQEKEASWLEAILYAILIFVVFVIFMLVFINVNERLANEILRFLFGHR